jgi:hypothetical protein
MCFLIVYTMHLRRFDLGFGVHFLSILVFTNKLFKLPSSLLLCMLCVHFPLEEVPFRVWCSLSIYPSSYRRTLSTHLLLCVLCVHCAFHQEIWFRVWCSFFYLSSYKYIHYASKFLVATHVCAFSTGRYSI